MKAGGMKGGRGGKRKGPARIGEIRVWGDGKKMRKGAGGKWEAVKEKAKAQVKDAARLGSAAFSARWNAKSARIKMADAGTIKVDQIRKKGEPSATDKFVAKSDAEKRAWAKGERDRAAKNPVVQDRGYLGGRQEKKPAAKKTTAAPAERKTTRDETDPKPFKAVLQVTDKKGVVREKRVEFKSESEREAHIDKLKHEGKLFDVWARYDKGDKLTPEGRASFDKKPPSAKKSSKGSAASRSRL